MLDYSVRDPQRFRTPWDHYYRTLGNVRLVVLGRENSAWAKGGANGFVEPPAGAQCRHPDRCHPSENVRRVKPCTAWVALRIAPLSIVKLLTTRKIFSAKSSR